MFDWLCFIMIMNGLHCQGRMLKSVHACDAGAITWFFFFLLTVESTTPFSHDNRNCKSLSFICVHSQINESFSFKLKFLFHFLKLLFKWKYISRRGLFIRYIYIYIYIYIAVPSFIMFFSSRRSTVGVWCDSYDDHVNPHVLLPAAFCACKINPRKTIVSIINGSQTPILSNWTQF